MPALCPLDHREQSLRIKCCDSVPLLPFPQEAMPHTPPSMQYSGNKAKRSNSFSEWEQLKNRSYPRQRSRGRGMTMFPAIPYNAIFVNGMKFVLTHLLLSFLNEVQDFSWQATTKICNKMILFLLFFYFCNHIYII